MSEVGKVRIGVEVDSKDLDSEVRKIDEKLSGATKKAGRESRIQLDRMADSMQSLGAKMTKAVTVPIAGAAAAAVKMASDYENQMAKVFTISDKAQLSNEQLSKDLLDLSTATGRAATELADAAYQALSASIETKDVVSFVGTAADLAKAGFLETAGAVDVLTTVINAYGMSAEDAEMISGRLVQTQNKGKTTVNELASSLGQAIPTAAAYNVSLDNLLSGYVVLTKQGINTANATTMLNGMMTELASEGSTVATILQEQTGKSFGQLMEDGYTLADVLDVLNRTVGGDSEAFANLWGNVRASKGALAIAKGGVDEFNEAMSSMEDSSTLVADALEELETPAVKANKAANALKNTGIQLGQELLAAAVPALDELVEVTQRVYEWFSSLDDSTKQSIVKWAALSAAIGPALIGFGKAIKGVQKLSGAIKAFNTVTSLSPAGIALMAAALAALAGVAIYDTIKKTNELKDAGHKLQDALGQQKDEADGLAGAFSNLGGEAQGIAGKVDSVTKSLEDAMDRQNRLAENIKQRNTDVALGTAELESYRETIERLSGSADDTNVWELTDAVNSLNEALGTDFQILQNNEGKYYVALGDSAEDAAGKIGELIEMQELQMRLDATRETRAELFKEQQQSAWDLADAVSNLGEAERDLETLRQNAENAPWYLQEGANMAYQQQAQEVEKLRGEVEALTAIQDDANDAYLTTQQNVEFLTKAMSDGGTEMERWIGTNDTLMAALSQSGKSAQDMASDLEWLGITTSDMTDLSVEELGRLVGEWDGHAATLKSTMQGFANEMPGIGYQGAAGLASGLNLGASIAVEAAKNLVRNALAAARAEAQQGSPWKTTISMGLYGAEGLAEGMEKGTAEAVSAAQSMIQKVLSATQIQDALQSIDWSGARAALTVPSMAPMQQRAYAYAGNPGGDTVYNFNAPITVQTDTAEGFIESMRQLSNLARL